jgi:hypothetical protein
LGLEKVFSDIFQRVYSSYDLSDCLLQEGYWLCNKAEEMLKNLRDGSALNRPPHDHPEH